MPKKYDDGEKYRWTHRCKEHVVEWGGLPKGGTRYPMPFMQVADYFVISDPARLELVHNALYGWERRFREDQKNSGSTKPPPKFAVRPVKGLPDIYICRRIS
jgi:hypothetical protein